MFPRARRELKLWELRASAIPDPVLRAHALAKLQDERIVAEGAAAFATLAVRRHRTAVIRICVAYEVMYDYLDAIGEDPVADPLAHNRCVHGALIDAIEPAGPCHDHYRHYSRSDDGGYLHALIDACREHLTSLPAARTVRPALRRFAARAGTAQSFNHAGTSGAHSALEAWAESQQIEDAAWWEVAAAASDPLGVFALFAAASNDQTMPCDVTAIEHAYYPWIGALVWLMESLTDEQEDALSGNHSYIGRYASSRHAADRLAVISRRATTATLGLPRGSQHHVLLTGVVSMYLSKPDADGEAMQACARAIRDEIRGPIAALMLVLRLRRNITTPKAFLRGANSWD